MQLSSDTLQVIKNFATINHGIEFKAGSKIRTISVGKTILAEANIKESFPEDFCVYDLNQFLSAYTLFKDGVPELDFDTANILFKLGNKKLKYRKTARETIFPAPDKNLALPSIDVAFELKAEDYDYIMRAANILSSPNIAVVSDGEEVSLVTLDAKDNSVHTNHLTIANIADGQKYKILFKTENVKMLPGAYDVVISFGGIGYFKNKAQDIQYWIAIEKNGSEF